MRYLENEHDHDEFSCYCLCFTKPTQTVQSLLIKKNIRILEESTFEPDFQENLLKEYIELIGNLGKWNGHQLHWWVSDIASKSPFNSPLLKPLRELIKFIDAMEELPQFKCSILLVEPTWPIVSYIEDRAKSFGWKVKLQYCPLSKFLHRIYENVKSIFKLNRSLAFTLNQIRKTRKNYGKYLHPIVNEKPVFLIKSFIYKNSFKDDDHYHDPFLGNLYDYIIKYSNDRFNVITVAVGFNHKQECYQKSRFVINNRIIPYESILKYQDVVKEYISLMAKLIFNPFRVNGKIKILSHDISDMIEEVISISGFRIQFDQYMHFVLGKRLAKQYQIDTCVMTYEGTPWEKPFVWGIKKYSPHTRIIGYQHSTIVKDFAGIFQGTRELSHIPLPDVITTTGSAPTHILRSYSAFPEQQIKTTCALRYEYLMGIKPVARRKTRMPFNVLVALCGADEILPLVLYVIDQAPFCKNAEFKVRPHPVTPFERLMRLSNYAGKLPDNIRLSDGGSVVEDIRECDVVLYWGSTIALEGIMHGRPVIHYTNGELFNHDPLFELKEFKWGVNDGVPLNRVLEKINNLKDDAYQERREKAASYVMTYFHPINEKALSIFIQ